MFFQEVNTQQLMQLRQVEGLEGDFGQVNWHLTCTQGAKILEKLSSIMCRFLQICMVVLDYFCSQKVRKYWRTLPLRCVRFFEDHRTSNFGNHPKSLECFGKRRTKASSLRHRKWVEGIPTINCSTMFLCNHFFPKIWPTNVTVTKIIMFNCKLRNVT